MVASFGDAWQGNADHKATTKGVSAQDLALLTSQPPRSGFVQPSYQGEEPSWRGILPV
jgi:hypothetical protein